MAQCSSISVRVVGVLALLALAAAVDVKPKKEGDAPGAGAQDSTWLLDLLQQAPEGGAQPAQPKVATAQLRYSGGTGGAQSMVTARFQEFYQRNCVATSLNTNNVPDLFYQGLGQCTGGGGGGGAYDDERPYGGYGDGGRPAGDEVFGAFVYKPDPLVCDWKVDVWLNKTDSAGQLQVPVHGAANMFQLGTVEFNCQVEPRACPGSPLGKKPLILKGSGGFYLAQNVFMRNVPPQDYVPASDAICDAYCPSAAACQLPICTFPCNQQRDAGKRASARGARRAASEAKVEAAGYGSAGSLSSPPMCYEASNRIFAGSFTVVGSSEFSEGGLFQFSYDNQPLLGTPTYVPCPTGGSVFNQYEYVFKFFTKDDYSGRY